MTFSFDDRAPELRDLFFESADEILQSMNEAGLALEANPHDVQVLRSVRRAVHTLKGDSAACGFRELSELAHELEDVLVPELAQENAASIAEVVLTAADTFHEMLAALRNDLRPPVGGALREHIRRLVEKPVEPVARASSGKAKFEWTEYERLMIAEALRRGETAYNLALRMEPDALPAAAFELARKALESCGTVLALHPQAVTLADSLEVVEAALATGKTSEWLKQHCHIPSVVKQVEIEQLASGPSAPRDLLEILLESEAAAVSAGLKTGSSDSGNEHAGDSRDAQLHSGIVHAALENNLRVDAGRIDTVMNLVGELIIGKSMLQRTVAEFEVSHSKDPLRAKFSDALAFQSRVLGELHKSVMKIRMVPVEQLFRRFPRIVRDVAKLRNKEVGIEMTGQNTDLDKGILDALSEPLAHIVRNAADHGIETAPERLATGKQARGTIRLNAYHEGDTVVIEVSDDGVGLDREKIVRRAIDQKIISPAEAARISESDALQLVFAPGLSTADEVTEVSGRGVGLDVVKTALAALKGSVEILTQPGKGTTFRLLVPLTLASVQALLFRVKDRLYAVPLASVVEITRLAEEEIHRVEEREVFQLRQQVLTLIRLDQLGCRAPIEHSKRLFVIIIGNGTRRFGLVVDSLAGEEELVVKALEDGLVRSPLVSGASILGDGRVVLILNVPAVLSHLSRIPAVGATA